MQTPTVRKWRQLTIGPRTLRTWSYVIGLAVLAVALCLAACRPSTQRTEVLPGMELPPLPGSSLFSIDDSASSVRLRVYRDGPMAAWGTTTCSVRAASAAASSCRTTRCVRALRCNSRSPASKSTIRRCAPQPARISVRRSPPAAGPARSSTCWANWCSTPERFPLVTLRSDSIARMSSGAAAAGHAHRPCMAAMPWWRCRCAGSARATAVGARRVQRAAVAVRHDTVQRDAGRAARGRPYRHRLRPGGAARAPTIV